MTLTWSNQSHFMMPADLGTQNMVAPSGGWLAIRRQEAAISTERRLDEENVPGRSIDAVL